MGRRARSWGEGQNHTGERGQKPSERREDLEVGKGVEILGDETGEQPVTEMGVN